MKTAKRVQQLRSVCCHNILFAASIALFSFFITVSTASAQSTGGRIRGTVTDASGGAVVGAKVTLVNEGTNLTREAQTSSNGEYLFLEVPVGSYEVDVNQTGFKKYARKGIVLLLSEIATVDIPLQVGSNVDTVEVTGAPPVIDTTTTQLGAVMTDQSVRELPLNSRNTYQLLQLQPGVQSQLGADLFYGSSNPGVVSVNGGRGRSNNYMVNGGDGNDIFVNGPAIQPSPDAIEEFRVLTNTFDAEYGRNSGSVVNVVTKSGTNNIHGDVYEFFRNTVLNSKPFSFVPAEKPDYRQNQFGATLGGPIKKDKTFVFASYEGNRLAQGISSGSVFLPTAQQAAGDFSAETPFAGTLTDQTFANALIARPGCQSAVSAAGGGTIAINTPYSTLFPNNQIPTACFDPTANALYKNFVAPVGTGQVNLVPNQNESSNQFTVRFDHNFSATQHFSAYYYFNDDDTTVPFSNFQAAGANVPGFGAITKTRVQQWNISHTSTIGSSAVNEFRFNYFREGQGNLNHPVNTLASLHDACGTLVSAANCFADPTNPSSGITTNIPGREGVPFVSVAGGFVIGNNFEGELPQIGNTFQWSDNYSKVIGTHSIKFGGDVRRQRFDQFLYFNINGDFSFQPGSATNSPAGSDGYPDFFLGTPTSYSQGAAQGENIRNTGLYLFAQDSWKIKSNLTLNYGLRWELNTPYVDTQNRIQTFRPGQSTTQYPCEISPAGATTINNGNVTGGPAVVPGSCQPGTPQSAYFPTGLVFPGDQGVPKGLTSTYYKAFAPRIGLAYSPSWSDGFLSKLTGGPGKSTIRGGYGIFYNPIEQLVLEQFSAEPPFGVSALLSNPLFNTPYILQNGTQVPNNAGAIIHQTPQTPCFDGTGPNGCVDWSLFRPILLFGEFQPHLRSQYSEQYNLTIERQLSSSMLFRIAYVGTQAHHLLASRDLNYGNATTCQDINTIQGPGSCAPFGSDSFYSVTVPAGMQFHLPYAPGPTPGAQNIPCPQVGAPSACTITGAPGGTPLTLVGLRPYSSPNCNPLNGVGCPADGTPIFSNIFTEDTIANSNYNGLQISVEKNYSHGLLFQASYTFSKAIDQGASFENELNPIDPRATRGISLLSAKNRFVFSPVWELPIPKKEGFAGKVANGWQLSAIITYQSGFPIRIQTQDDAELQSSFFFEDANTPQVTGKVQFVNPKANNGLWFNTSNIADPALGTFGNMPHALCCGPALSNTDLVIAKRTPLTEKINTEFRAEFYNTWNHTEFENPDGNFTDSTFGQILKTRDPRVMQFALKILF
ncbi:MAG TPA: carboxypeptidase regulatory-like domain-containing protein [Candidatus Sulfotelmatobacter sp.]|nr:carboxypeptidase regulatory-like domain-containing protein [Candidatus Sulfotelmatobacter sp.]